MSPSTIGNLASVICRFLSLRIIDIVLSILDRSTHIEISSLNLRGKHKIPLESGDWVCT